MIATPKTAPRARATAHAPRPYRVGVAVSLPVREKLRDPAVLAAYQGAIDCGEQAVVALGEARHEAFLLAVHDDAQEAIARLQDERVDVVVNFVEEMGGRAAGEADFAEALERSGLPFTGSSARTLLLTLDKGESKRCLAHHGIPVPDHRTVPPGEPVEWPDAWLPAIVKPVHEDGSIGVERESVCRDANALRERVRIVHSRFEQPAIVERFVEGREFNVALLEGKALPLSEIEFGEVAPEPGRAPFPGIVTYDSKWTPGSADDLATKPVCPARVDAALELELRRIAGETFRAFGVRDYGRVDVRVDAEGRPFVLEANANPDLSADAGLVRAAAVAGIDLARLYDHIVRLAVARAQQPSLAPPTPEGRSR